MSEHEINAERLKHAVDLARDGLRALVLINGGAIIGLFTLIGAISAADHPVVQVRGFELQQAFVAFGLGVFCAVAATLCGYLSQDWFFQSMDRLLFQKETGEARDYLTPWKHANLIRWAAIGFAVVSLFAFLTGSWFALWGVLPTS